MTVLDNRVRQQRVQRLTRQERVHPKRFAAVALLVALFGCEPAFVGTAAPKDAKFDVTCAGGCGKSGRDAGMIIDVTFLGSYSRQVSVCCEERDALRARLQTAADHWCDGLEVPDTKVGDITIGTTVSQASGKRGVTLDQGAGYVAFNCDDWLPKLTKKLETTACCASAAPAAAATQPAPPATPTTPTTP